MSTTTRAATVLAAGTLTLTLATPADTAAAIPPQAEEIAPLLAVFPDTDNGLVGFLNVTREDWCAWEAAGYPGGPEAAPLLEPTSPAWEHTTGTGQVSGVARAELQLELWPIDADAALEGACEDTDDADEPFATGVADVRASDSDPYGTYDGHGVVYLGDMTINAELAGTDGNRYGYHLHVIELVDANGIVRHADSDHMSLTKRG